MKVKELIRLLQQIDAERTVVVSCDPEGNRYSRLTGIDPTAMFRGDEVGLETLTDNLREMGFREEDVMEDGEKAIVLYP